MTRRGFAVGLAGAGIGLLVPAAAGTAAARAATSHRSAPAVGPGGADRGRWRRRALHAYEALQEHYDMPARGFDREELGDDTPAYVWTARETTAATVSVAQLPGAGTRLAHDVVDRFDRLERYWDTEHGAYASFPPPPYGTNGDRFFDDNAVVGLELVRRYRISGDPRALRRARRVFEFLPRAWDTDDTVEHPGGMHWVDAAWNPYRGATNVTSLTSELAAHLYQITGEQDYLRWARRTYRWVRGALRRGDGLYANGITMDGAVEETLWSYNSGSMIGAATLLHRATGDPTCLDAALTDARGALDHWSRSDRLYDQPAIFNAILFANLLVLDQESDGGVAGLREIMADYADRIWTQNRDEDTGLFRFGPGGGGSPDESVTPMSLHQAGAVQILALLGWRTADLVNAA